MANRGAGQTRLIAVLLAGALAAGALLAGGPAGAGGLEGSFTLGTGYLDNPLGLTHETSAGYLTQSLRLATVLGPAAAVDLQRSSQFKLGYEGNASQFGQGTELGSMRHGLGLEVFRTSRPTAADPRPNSLSAGVQAALRAYQGAYVIYDHREIYGYCAFRRYVGAQVLWSGFAALRARHYGELPEESYLEPHGQLKIQRFFDGRTTLGLSLRLGVKTFNDSAASAVWDTPSLPSTSQAAARLDFAQGMSDRLGLRVGVDSRHTLSDFPYYVADDLFDSPLLDTYAHQGEDYFAAVKWLAPGQVWAELGASRGTHDYGPLLFATAPAGETRDDVVSDYTLSLDRTLNGRAGGPRLRLAGGWRRQVSTIEAYTFDGLFASSSLSLNF